MGIRERAEALSHGGGHMVCLSPQSCPGSLRKVTRVSAGGGETAGGGGDEMPAQDPKRRLILPLGDWSQGSKKRRLAPAPTSAMAS